jgi:hypothetical protein
MYGSSASRSHGDKTQSRDYRKSRGRLSQSHGCTSQNPLGPLSHNQRNNSYNPTYLPEFCGIINPRSETITATSLIPPCKEFPECEVKYQQPINSSHFTFKCDVPNHPSSHTIKQKIRRNNALKILPIINLRIKNEISKTGRKIVPTVVPVESKNNKSAKFQLRRKTSIFSQRASGDFPPSQSGRWPRR